MDVLYFVHDSAPYMAAAGDRLRVVLGYKNLIHLPCWAHLLDVVGSVVFNQQVLPEYSEYIRLNRCAIHAFFFWHPAPCIPGFSMRAVPTGGTSGRNIRMLCTMRNRKKA